MAMFRNIFYILISSLLFVSCYEPVEGCLDPDAKNYNVTADDDCTGCCQLPQVDLVFTYLYNGNSFNLGDTLSAGNELFQLKDFHIYLSNISVNGAEDLPLYLEDSVRIVGNDGTPFFVGDNYRYFDRQRFSASLDGLRYTGQLSSIGFEVGIPQSFNLYNADSLRINSMLSTIPTDAYIEGSGFIFFSFNLEFIAGEAHVLQLINTFPLTEVRINLSGITVAKANDASLSLIFDLGTALSGISMNLMSEENVAIIRNNLQNAFRQKQ